MSVATMGSIWHWTLWCAHLWVQLYCGVVRAQRLDVGQLHILRHRRDNCLGVAFVTDAQQAASLAGLPALSW
jgi:hypothetical protein